MDSASQDGGITVGGYDWESVLDCLVHKPYSRHESRGIAVGSWIALLVGGSANQLEAGVGSVSESRQTKGPARARER